MKAIENKNKVDIKTIEKYDEINGHDVIRETLLFKGCEICSEKASVRYIQKNILRKPRYISMVSKLMLQTNYMLAMHLIYTGEETIYYQ